MLPAPFGRLCFALTLCIALSCGVAAQSQPADLLPVARLQQLLQDYRFQEGSAVAENALEAVRGARGEKDLLYAEAMYWLGVFRHAASRYPEAAQWHAKALALREELLGPDALEVAQSSEHLALAYDSQAQRDAAEPLMLRALSLSERLLPADDPQLASTLNNVGMFFVFSRAQYEQGERLLLRALEIRKKAFGPNHATTASSLLALGKLSALRGKYTEADAFYGQALEAYESSLGPQHPNVARTLLNLSTLYMQQGRLSEAETHLKSALEIYKAALGDDDERVALCLNSLASLYRTQGRVAEAEPLIVRTLEIQQKLLGPDHPDVARTLTNLGALQQLQRHFEDAEASYLRALAIREKRLGADHPEVAITLTRLAAFYQSLGRNDDAEMHINRAIKIRSAAFGDQHADVGFSISVLAGILEQRGRYAEAEKQYRRALKILESALGPNQLEVAATKHNLGALLKSLDRLPEAALYLKAAFVIRQRELKGNHPALIDSYIQLAELFRLVGRAQEARQMLDRARALSQSGIKEVQVFFGTGRARVGDASTVTFGNTRAPKGAVSLGMARVALPPNLKRPGTEALTRDESTDVARLAIQTVDVEDEAALAGDVQRARIQAKLFKNDVLVFIHGYNVSFENAVRRTAQIAYDLNFDGPTIVFSWPSQGRLWGYLADRDEVDIASGQLRQFLAKVVMKAKVQKVHFIAHSMGNLVLLRALETIGLGRGEAQLPLGAIITAAPDVDPDVFAQFANRTSSGGANVTLYVSGDDRALWLSGWLKSRSRAGYVSGTAVPVAGTETIDITGLRTASLFALNHDVYASTPLIVGDMRAVLLGDHPPDRRTPEFQRVTVGSDVYWKYQPAAKGQ